MSGVSDQVQIDLPVAALEEFCRRWHITELALFGSVLRADFRADSDIDVLVTFDPAFRRSLDDMLAMQDEAEALFGRAVDLITRRSIERSRNYLRRHAILSTARTIYAA